ncbi:MAG: hypothetical protein ABIK89_19530 [Planctomycetota bacterium]
MVTGVTDLYPQRREHLRNRYGCDKVYDSLAITVPGIVAHQSSFKDGEQLDVPQFERPKA